MYGTTDGRNIDSERGSLSGEAARVEVDRPAEAFPLTDVHPDAAGPGYYGTPPLEEPVWKGYIPLYFYTGGAAGAASVLGAVAQLRGDALESLVSRARRLAAVGLAASTVLLIVDLGRPSRFLNMLRVFRPTSPMSIGTWVLTPAGASAVAAALLPTRARWQRALGDAAGLAAGVLGLPLSGYTGVLLANTAIPVWQGARYTLPWLFIASSISSAGALLELLPDRPAAERVLRRFSSIGKVGEILGMDAVERELGPKRRRPLEHGRSAKLWKLAKGLTWASLLVSLPLLPKTPRRIGAALLGTAGGLALRFAIVGAGRSSAEDTEVVLELEV